MAQYTSSALPMRRSGNAPSKFFELRFDFRLLLPRETTADCFGSGAPEPLVLGGRSRAGRSEEAYIGSPPRPVKAASPLVIAPTSRQRRAINLFPGVGEERCCGRD